MRFHGPVVEQTSPPIFRFDPDPDGEAPSVTLTLRPTTDGWEASTVLLRGRITSRGLRLVPLRELVDRAVACLRRTS